MVWNESQPISYPRVVGPNPGGIQPQFGIPNSYEAHLNQHKNVETGRISRLEILRLYYQNDEYLG